MYYGYLVGFGYMLLLLGVSELLTRFTRVPKEIVRKLLHMMIGFEYLVLHDFFAYSWQIVVIPAFFVVFNTLTFRFKWLHSIDRGQGEHLGIIYYALSITALSVVTALVPDFLYPFGVGVFCLSFGDCAAALVGKYVRPRIRLLGQKTLWGMVACFAFAWIGQLLLCVILGQKIDWIVMLAISAVAGACEVSVGKGLDNIAIPVWTGLFAFGFYVSPALLPLFALLFAAYLLIALTYSTHAFTLMAALLSGVMLVAITDLGGWGAFTLVVSSYGIVFVADKIADVIHTKRTGVKPYHQTRTVAQVLQNGLPALLALIVYHFVPHAAFLAAYAVAIGESLVDSISSDLGVLSKGKPIDIISHKTVETGKSGGVSLWGTACGCIAAIVTPLLFGAFWGWHWAIVLLFGWQVGGMLLDSVVGSLLQVRYRCTLCDKVIDKPIHCGRPCQMAGGLRWLTNGRVNLLVNLLTTLTIIPVVYFVL